MPKRKDGSEMSEVEQALEAMGSGAQKQQDFAMERQNNNQQFLKPAQDSDIAYKGALTSEQKLQTELGRTFGFRKGEALTGDMENTAASNVKWGDKFKQNALDDSTASRNHMVRVDDAEALALKLQKLNLGAQATLENDRIGRDTSARTRNQIVKMQDAGNFNPVGPLTSSGDARVYEDTMRNELGLPARSPVNKLIRLLPGVSHEQAYEVRKKVRAYNAGTPGYSKLAIP